MEYTPCPVCDFPFEPEDPLFTRHVNDHYEQTAETNKKTPAGGPEGWGRYCEYEDCGKWVPTDEWQTHNDFHAAEKLEAERLEESMKQEKETFANLKRKGSFDASDDTESSSLNQAKHQKPNGYTEQYARNLDRALETGKITATEYHEQLAQLKAGEVPLIPGVNGTPGLIPMLRTLLLASAKGGVRMSAQPNWTSRAYLCHPATVHYCADFGDSGSCLLGVQSFSTRLAQEVGSSEVPSIPKLQHMLEMAWAKGFDRAGAQDLSFEVSDSRKWIGTTEAAALFLSLGLRAEVYDFHKPTGPDGTHPALFDFVLKYFTGEDEGLGATASNGGERAPGAGRSADGTGGGTCGKNVGGSSSKGTSAGGTGNNRNMTPFGLRKWPPTSDQIVTITDRPP
ncbi:hypothetical protein HK104_001868, partial [Borealophlyctis nickersoniae]